MGLFAFRTPALRRLASRKSMLEAWLLLTTGFLLFSVVRSLVYASHEGAANPSDPKGWAGGLFDLHVIHLLLFVAVIYIPAVICLANALAGDGLGFSFSRAEYRTHISVLFPLWGILLLLAAIAQWLIPQFVELGNVAISAALLGLLPLLVVYSVWAIKEINYVTPIMAFGVFVLSWFTIPLFYVMTSFLYAVPSFIMIFILYLLYRNLRDYLGGRSGEKSFQQHLHSLTINPQDAEAHHQLGLIHFRRGNLSAARTCYEQAISILGQDPYYRYHLGRLFEEMGDWPKALEQYEETYRLNPEFGLRDIFREVGKGYLHTDNLDAAVEFLKFFLETRPSDPEARYWLAVTFQKQGRPEEMHREIRTLLEMARTNPRFFRKENRRWLYRARAFLRDQGSGAKTS
jgi:tetratricopeptide (TPR) repeat protein